ncbi:MAG: hypothetical protein ABR598_07725 [Candidatus Dormibacteria bacterium]
MSFSIDTDAFLAGLSDALRQEEELAQGDQRATAAAIAQRWRDNLPEGGMRDAVKVVANAEGVDVGIIPGSGLVTQSGTSVDDAALPDEFGHHDGSVYVEPRPAARRAIADELTARATRPVDGR